ncbi:MAG: TetR/AcrR family transcriptional regulator [Bacteroidota bacterium]
MQDRYSFLSFVPQKSMEPQEKILKTSLNLFFKYGIKHVTMDDIAKELGMSKKTIYHFYKEKDDLVNQLCEMEMLLQEDLFNKINEEAMDPIHEIMMISQKMREMMQNINPIFFMDLQKFYPEAFKRFQKFKESCAFQKIVDNIMKGINLGIYRKDFDVVFAARYRLSQIDTLMFGNHIVYEKISFVRAHELMFEMFVYGICTVKGHKLINNYKKIHEEE